ncbi:MAG TPA: HIRAN domain-containing protein [Ktedonobacteraceae bacterium]|nr:HIRAN domain-containing protein [Ktedonobacteraceae bacterium]
MNTFEDTKPAFDFTFEIAGFRHHGLKEFPEISTLQDKEVTFAHETSNPHDNEAIAMTYQRKKLGYVPKGFTGVIKGLIETYQLSAFIERINGTPERPSILIFVEVR